MDTKIRILKHARNLFLTYGIKNITLDDLAKDLGISKKTIYQYFENKASIVYDVIKAYFEEERNEVTRVHNMAENAIDELVKICIWTSKTFENMSPRLIYEVNKYYPKSFEIQHEYLTDFVLVKLTENLERGIREGLYRKDLDPDTIARIRISQFEFPFTQAVFPDQNYDMWDLQLELFILYMYGIVSGKGRSLWEQQLPLIPRKKLKQKETSP